MLSHGEWGKWLKEEIHYSKSSANNMMRILTPMAAHRWGCLAREGK